MRNLKSIVIALILLSVVFGTETSVYATHTGNPVDHQGGIGTPTNPNSGLGTPTNPNSELGTPSNPNPPINGSIQLENPLKNITSITGFFVAIIEILIIFAVPFIVFFIIYAGFQYVVARGNPEAIKKAHAALLYALIGGLLILGSRTLLTIIENTVTQIK